MQIHSDRFETVLPKGRFFTPKTTKPLQRDWRAVIITAICAITLIAGIKQITHPPAPVVSAPVVTATPPPLPEVRKAERLPQPILNPVLAPPRAQLVHVRPIGTFERLMMPDGRVLGTTYRGELRSAAGLPTTGGQPGDMWFTRADGHSWVLAPVTAGSQSMGWVDP